MLILCAGACKTLSAGFVCRRMQTLSAGFACRHMQTLNVGFCMQANANILEAQAAVEVPSELYCCGMQTMSEGHTQVSTFQLHCDRQLVCLMCKGTWSRVMN